MSEKQLTKEDFIRELHINNSQAEACMLIYEAQKTMNDEEIIKMLKSGENFEKKWK